MDEYRSYAGLSVMQWLESPDAFNLLEDTLSEAPNKICALRRFNIYQEVCFGVLYQGFRGFGMTPGSFYCMCVFLLYGFGLWAFFGSLKSSAEVVLCGALYLSSWQEGWSEGWRVVLFQ
eukprot:symbB.v1.2.006741.t1/scaffold403.1/size211681/6